jgi:hypothetical protein
MEGWTGIALFRVEISRIARFSTCSATVVIETVQLMFKYHNKGYQVWDYPIWLVRFMKNKFNISLNWGYKNCNIELYIPGSNQVTWYTPW